MLNTIFNVDSRKISEILPEDVKIQTTISSPPYYDMKDYGMENQIGFGQSYEAYLLDIKSVFEQVYQYTKEDGTLWIIIDTFKRNDPWGRLEIRFYQDIHANLEFCRRFHSPIFSGLLPEVGSRTMIALIEQGNAGGPWFPVQSGKYEYCVAPDNSKVRIIIQDSFGVQGLKID